MFGYLKLSEKVKLRLVCKEWAGRIDADCKLTSILVCKNLQSKSKWYTKWIDTNEFADLRNVFRRSELKSLFVRSANQLVDRIHNLSFFYSDIATINRLLTKFKGIVRLQIDGLNMVPGWNNDQLTIDQPQLKVLVIDVINSMRTVTVNAPVLKFVKLHVYSETHKFNFIHPQSVENLELQESHAEFNAAFESLVCLKVLVLNETKRGEKLKDDLLCKMTALKELHFFDSRLFGPLTQQKKKFKLDQLTLYFCGLSLARLDQYNCDNFSGCILNKLDNKRLQLYVDNYFQMADQLYFEKEISYDAIRALYPSIPVNFLAKFTRLSKVILSSVIEDEDQFCEFLIQCRSIRSLQFEIGTVSEQLMKRIVCICSYLRELKIEDPDVSLETTESDAFLKLLFGFKHLTKFEIDQRINLKFMKKVFRFFTDLDHFSFFFGEGIDGYEIDYYAERPSYLLAKNDDPYGNFKLNTIFEKFRTSKADDLGVIFV